MNRQKIKGIISLLIAVLALINLIYLNNEDNKIKDECIALYEQEHLTAEDLKTKSQYKSAILYEDKGKIQVKYKKLYGVERIGEFELDKNDGIKMELTEGDRLKVLIVDEAGDERFYCKVSELRFEPGESGKYEIYVVGNSFTGTVTFSTY